MLTPFYPLGIQSFSLIYLSACRLSTRLEVLNRHKPEFRRPPFQVDSHQGKDVVREIKKRGKPRDGNVLISM
ncbi:MAG TPA: hypothetical protein DCR87_05060 [Acidobacteria bacterium]|nr:hypothetical protein [Acidobacteriota bacterium]